MKKIEAVIRPSKLEAIRAALIKKDMYGMTVSDILGYRQKGHIEIYRGNKYIVDLFPKKKIEIVVRNEKYLKEALEIIKKYAYTRETGDGKIFIYDIEKVIRIRTNEENEQALI